jgi:hypothetical protein
LYLNGAANCIDYAAELDQSSVTSALHDAPVMDRDSWIDQIAPERPKPRKRTIFICSREPAISDDVGHQYCGELSRLTHEAIAVWMV